MPPKRCVHVLRLSLWNANSESTTWRFRCCKEYPRRIKGSARYANRFDFDTSSKSNVRQGCVSSSHTDSAGDGGSLAGTARCAACASPPVGAAASEVMRAAETAGRQGGRCAGWHWRLSERRRRGNGRLDRAARVCLRESPFREAQKALETRKAPRPPRACRSTGHAPATSHPVPPRPSGVHSGHPSAAAMRFLPALVLLAVVAVDANFSPTRSPSKTPTGAPTAPGASSRCVALPQLLPAHLRAEVSCSFFKAQNQNEKWRM
jgi:hypothetical protein